MKTYKVSGAGGVQLHLDETGNPSGKPILFIHGFSQSRLAWKKQMDSDLADDFRLIAMDIRGHGLSDKPRDAYGESKLWADDIDAVMTAAGLEKPVMVGWSYGPIIITDYVSHYGEGNLGGSNWVGGVSRLGDPLVQHGFLGADFLSCVPGFFSENADESSAALEKLIRACVHREPSPQDVQAVLSYNTIVPSHVRYGLLARNVNNDAIIEKMRTPILLTYGAFDRVALPSMRDHIASLAPHARVSVYPETGHSPFWEAPERFNRELREFRESI